MEDYVTFEQAKKLKKFGFDWECNHYYDKQEQFEQVVVSNYDNYYNCNSDDFEDACSAPTLSQSQKWLREVKEICVTSSIKIHKGKYKFNWSITLFKEGRGIWDESVIYDTYEQALSAGIDKALELLK